MVHIIWSICYDTCCSIKFPQDFIPDFGVFGDNVCDLGSFADLGQAKSVCKDGLNFLECDIILELRARRKFFQIAHKCSYNMTHTYTQLSLWKSEIFSWFDYITGLHSN